MGNVCQGVDPCGFSQQRMRTRMTESLEQYSKIGQKDLIKIKKYNIQEEYTILEHPIGKGSFGTVYKIIHKQSHLEWAAKKIPIDQVTDKYLQEIYLLKHLDHPNIIRIIEVFKEEKYYYVVMEKCNGGELFDRIVQRNDLSEGLVKKFMLQLLSAISYCHMNHIMHRDLKPQNIMIISKKNQNLKIIDFGVGTIKKKGEVNTLKVGSIYYIAPEVIKKKYNQKCDVWSLGVIMYMMLSGSAPFNAKSDQAIFQKILEGRFSFPDKKWQGVSQDAKDLIRKMLEYNPQKRISARQALSHPWILSQNDKNYNSLLSEQICSLKQFCGMNKFKQYITTFMSHNLFTAQSLQILHEQFQAMDTNKDGRISWNEFEQCMKRSQNLIEDQKIRKMFNKIDKNSSGFIDYSEFISSAMGAQLTMSQQLVQKAFDMIDLDKDGFLSREQIYVAMGGVEENLFDHLLEEGDLNKDGAISKQQFFQAMLNISQSRIKQSQHSSKTMR